MPKTLADFKPTHVPGLYSYDHFEAPDGAFIQRRHGIETYLVYQNAQGSRFTFESHTALKTHLAKED